MFKKKERKKEAKDGEEEDYENSAIDNQDDSKLTPDEAMNHALLKLTTIMVREQNFLMDFFGIVKTATAVTTTSHSNINLTEQLEEETLETWQNSLCIPRQAFKDQKAEKKIRYNR